MDKSRYVRAMVALILITGFLLVLMHGSVCEKYTEKEVVQRFKDFSIGLSGNNPYIEPEEGADVSVVEMDAEVLKIYKNMRNMNRSLLDKIIDYSRSESNHDFKELSRLMIDELKVDDSLNFK